MKIIVKITKPLKRYFTDSEISLEVSDFEDIVSALKNLFPKFNELLSQIRSKTDKFQDIVLVQDKKPVDIKKYKFPLTSSSPIYVVPILFGHSNNYGFTDLYKDIKSSFLFPLFGLSTAGTEQMDFEGLDRRIRDSSLFGRAEDIYDVGLRNSNDVFGALNINTTANSPIPLNYGLIRVSGTLINAYIRNYRADPDEFRLKDIIYGGEV